MSASESEATCDQSRDCPAVAHFPGCLGAAMRGTAVGVSHWDCSVDGHYFIHHVTGDGTLIRVTCERCDGDWKVERV